MDRNYTADDLINAIKLANLCREESYQDSWLIVSNDKTIWDSKRNQQ